MGMMNRLGNAKNIYQTPAKRVLAVCSAGLLRSPTVANVLHHEYGFNTRAAGITDEYALVPVDIVLLEWADEIVCVEPAIAYKVGAFVANNRPEMVEAVANKTTVLNIPDAFEWNHPDLRKIIIEQYQEVGK